MGIVLMFIGFTGKAFDKDITVDLGMGGKFNLGRYELRIDKIDEGQNDNYGWQRAKVDVYSGGQHVHTLYPERRGYKVSRQGTSEVAIWRRLNEDLYLNFAGSNEPGKAVIQGYVFPL